MPPPPEQIMMELNTHNDESGAKPIIETPDNQGAWLVIIT